LKSKKKATPPDAYGSSFMAWWIAIQPKWRLADDSSFVYSLPALEDWRMLHKGGSSGLYTAVVALSWWVKALSPTDSPIRVWTAVHDVQWVIDQINQKIAASSVGKKQGSQGPEVLSSPGGEKGRIRDIFSFIQSANDFILDIDKNLSSPGGEKGKFRDIFTFIQFAKDFKLDNDKNLSSPGGPKGKFRCLFTFIQFAKDFKLDIDKNLSSPPGGQKGKFRDILFTFKLSASDFIH
jgi:hypothetical protein